MKRKLSLRTENEPPNYENEVRMKNLRKILKTKLTASLNLTKCYQVC